MHIPDGYLGPSTCVALYGGAAPFWWIALRRMKRALHTRMVPLLSLFSAFSFIVMMFNLPLPAARQGMRWVSRSPRLCWVRGLPSWRFRSLWRSKRYFSAMAELRPRCQLLQHGGGGFDGFVRGVPGDCGARADRVAAAGGCRRNCGLCRDQHIRAGCRHRVRDSTGALSRRVRCAFVCALSAAHCDPRDDDRAPDHRGDWRRWLSRRAWWRICSAPSRAF